MFLGNRPIYHDLSQLKSPPCRLVQMQKEKSPAVLAITKYLALRRPRIYIGLGNSH